MQTVWVVSSKLFGFSGLQVMFSRYLLNIGTPFENWLTRLAEAAQREPGPASYLRRTTELLADFPWLSWQSPDGAGQLGQFSKHDVQVQEGELRLTVYTRQSLNPTALFDCVLDSLLDSALRKRQTGHDVTISVEMRAEPLCITVCDSGDPIPEAIITRKGAM